MLTVKAVKNYVESAGRKSCIVTFQSALTGDESDTDNKPYMSSVVDMFQVNLSRRGDNPNCWMPVTRLDLHNGHAPMWYDEEDPASSFIALDTYIKRVQTDVERVCADIERTFATLSEAGEVPPVHQGQAPVWKVDGEGGFILTETHKDDDDYDEHEDEDEDED